MKNDASKHACFVKANKVLAKDNTTINFAYSLTDMGVTPIIDTCKLDDSKRGKPKRLMASHCPFCGSALQKK
jgi:hypothetical protein